MPSVGAEGVGQGRLHVPDRQAPHEADDDEGLEGRWRDP